MLKSDDAEIPVTVSHTNHQYYWTTRKKGSPMTIERARLYDWMLNNLPNLDFDIKAEVV